MQYIGRTFRDISIHVFSSPSLLISSAVQEYVSHVLADVQLFDGDLGAQNTRVDGSCDGAALLGPLRSIRPPVVQANQASIKLLAYLQRLSDLIGPYRGTYRIVYIGFFNLCWYG